MRIVFSAVLALFAVFFVSPPALGPAVAQEACRCKGCGCKGGSGWRGPDGACVSKAKLAEICGSPAGTPCKEEAAARVCFGRSAQAAPASPAQPQ